MKTVSYKTSGSIAALLAISLADPAVAADGPATDTTTPLTIKHDWAASVRWENDTFSGTDRYYTDGVSIGLSETGPNWLDPLADSLPWGEGRRTIGYDLSQSMFTPDDLRRHIPDPNDRPYAGILTFGLTLHVESDNSYNGLKVVGGMVGPASLAEQTQKTVHSVIGNKEPEGWDYQLKNEPIFNLAYEYRHRFELAGERKHWSAEAIPLGGGWLGNMLIQGQAGGILRAGYNMPNDYGPTLMRGMSFMPPPKQDAPRGSRFSDWGFAFYGGAVGHLVLHDITLDGNTFEHSRNVDKKYFLPMTGVGMSVGNRRLQASFSYVFWGKQFDGELRHSEFGALTLTYLF
jgi:hypothetical protein